MKHFIWKPRHGLEPVEQLPEGVQGVTLTDTFVRGAIAVASINSRDNRFIIPHGFSKTDLLTEQSFHGYYQTRQGEPPRKIRMLVDELAARATGLEVYSPRGRPDGVESVDYVSDGLPARMMWLYRDEQMLREEVGVADKRPELARPVDECVRDGALYVTSETDRAVARFASGKSEHQANLDWAVPETVEQAIKSLPNSPAPSRISEPECP